MRIPMASWRTSPGAMVASALLVVFAAALIVGVQARGEGARAEGLMAGSEIPDVWCPCTGQYVRRIEDCPDCRIDGLNIDRNPRLVTIRGTNVQGQLEATVGRTTDELRIGFVWNTGDTLATTGGYTYDVTPANGNMAGWERARANFRGRLRGRGPGTTTVIVRLREEGTNRVVYASPPIRLVVTNPQ